MSRRDAYEGDGPLVVASASGEVLRHPEAGGHLLTALEQRRASRFHHESGRIDFTAAHILVRLCAARLLGIPAAGLTLAQHCPGCGTDEHGKPYLIGLPDVHVSLSHTRGVVAAAAGWQPVGIDVELPQRGGPAVGVAERVLTEGELHQVRAQADPSRAFLRQWVRKEAMIKIGRATLDTLDRLDLSALPPDVEGDAPCAAGTRTCTFSTGGTRPTCRTTGTGPGGARRRTGPGGRSRPGRRSAP